LRRRDVAEVRVRTPVSRTRTPRQSRRYGARRNVTPDARRRSSSSAG
jgi:hypothetical protein